MIQSRRWENSLGFWATFLNNDRIMSYYLFALHIREKVIKDYAWVILTDA